MTATKISLTIINRNVLFFSYCLFLGHRFKNMWYDYQWDNCPSMWQSVKYISKSCKSCGISVWHSRRFWLSFATWIKRRNIVIQFNQLNKITSNLHIAIQNKAVFLLILVFITEYNCSLIDILNWAIKRRSMLNKNCWQFQITWVQTEFALRLCCKICCHVWNVFLKRL